jgi:hypothetical protein
MPYKPSSVRRVQASFDAALEQTIYEASVTLDPTRNAIRVVVADPDNPELTVVSCQFDYSPSIRTAQPADDELQHVKSRFAAICQAYASPAPA